VGVSTVVIGVFVLLFQPYLGGLVVVVGGGYMF